MTEAFVDKIVNKLLETYDTDDMDMRIDSLKDNQYQHLMRLLKGSYGIRPYGYRSKIRKKLEQVLIIKYWDELMLDILNDE